MRFSEPSYDNVLHNSCADAPKSGPLSQPNLKRSVLKRIFETASQEKTRDANRRKLYAFVKANSEDDEDDDVGDSAASNLSRGSEDGDSDEEMWAHVPDILPIPDDVMEGVPEGAGDRNTCML